MVNHSPSIRNFRVQIFYKKQIYVCGSTDNLKDLIIKNNYLNINFSKRTFKSKNISYVDEFIKIYEKHKFNLIEIHNRPSYVNYLILKQQ